MGGGSRGWWRRRGWRRGARRSPRGWGRPAPRARPAPTGRSRRPRRRCPPAACCSSSGSASANDRRRSSRVYGPAGLVVRVVAAPQVVVDPDRVPGLGVDRAGEAGPDPDVAVEVLARVTAAGRPPGRTSARRCGRAPPPGRGSRRAGPACAAIHDAPCSVSTSFRSGKRSNTPPTSRWLSVRRDQNGGLGDPHHARAPGGGRSRARPPPEWWLTTTPSSSHAAHSGS